jgi:hypothetical protein
MTTVKEAAEMLGLKVYDTALPQNWVDDFYKVTGVWPAGLFVWSYDEAKTWGEPYPLTMATFKLFLQYEKAKKNGA